MGKRTRKRRRPVVWRWPLPNGVTISLDRAGRWRVSGRWASAEQAAAAMLHTIALDCADAVGYRSDVQTTQGALVADLSDASWSVEDAASALQADSEDPGFERPDDPEADLRAWSAWAADFARSKPGKIAQSLGRLLIQATAVVVGEHYRASKAGRESGYEDLFADEQVEVMGGSYSGLDPEGYRETFDKLRARLDGLSRAGNQHEVWVAGLFFRWEFGSKESVAERLWTRLGRQERRKVEPPAPATREDLEEELLAMGYDEEEIAEVLGEAPARKRMRKRTKKGRRK